MSDKKKETIVLKLGGSLIVPNGGLNISYIKKFYTFIRNQVAEKNRRFFIFIGGGLLSRHYRDAGAEITGHELTVEDLDWLGIHATRLNAHLFRTIFRDLAHPVIINDYEVVYKSQKPIVIAAGWKPGWSTDYDAVILAQDYNVKTVIKMSNTNFIFDRDPRKFNDAKALKKLTWKKYRSMIGNKWVPGAHAPFDPIASRLASELGLKVVYLNGKDLDNLEKALNSKNFEGTIIE